jgi:hypothetical protein
VRLLALQQVPRMLLLRMLLLRMLLLRSIKNKAL